MAGKHIRAYHVYDIPGGAAASFPWEPDTTAAGCWISANDREGLAIVSACGLKFTDELYDFLNTCKDVPVGFLNVSWGGTTMATGVGVSIIFR